jgi:hypothetical protein
VYLFIRPTHIRAHSCYASVTHPSTNVYNYRAGATSSLDKPTDASEFADKSSGNNTNEPAYDSEDSVDENDENRYGDNKSSSKQSSAKTAKKAAKVSIVLLYYLHRHTHTHCFACVLRICT